MPDRSTVQEGADKAQERAQMALLQLGRVEEAAQQLPAVQLAAGYWAGVEDALRWAAGAAPEPSGP